METLADVLGVRDPTVSVEASSTPDPGPECFEHLSGKDFALAVLNSSEFRQYIVNGLAAADLPPAVLCRLIDHGWGKPVERVEVQTVASLDGLSPEELRAHLQERVESLVTMMRMLDPEDETGSVH
jgi:hypothetical protein